MALGDKTPRDFRFNPHQANLNQDLSQALVSTSMSGIISGVAGFMNDYFRTRFPEGFFRDGYINTQLNQFKFSVPYAQTRTPFLAMTTQYTPEQTEMGPMFRQYTGAHFVRNNDKDFQYRKIIHDPRNRNYMWSIDNRVKLTFNFAIRLQTEMQAINVVNYISQNFESGGKMYYNDVSIPVQVPTDIVKSIAKQFNWTIDDLHNKEANRRGREYLREYFLKYGVNPVTESINAQTGNVSYNYDFVTNLLMTFPDIASSERTMSGLIVKDATVRYAIEVDMWFPSRFIYESSANFIRTRSKTDEMLNNVVSVNISMLKPLIPEFLPENDFSRLQTVQYSPDFNQEVDTIELDGFFTTDIQNIITSAKKYGYNHTKLFQVKIFANNEPLAEGENFEVDWDKMEMRFLKPQRNVAYTLVTYGDKSQIAKLNSYLQNRNSKAIFAMDIFTGIPFEDKL